MRWDRPWPVGVFILIWLGWFFTGASSFTWNLIEFITLRLEFLGQINESVAAQWNLRTTPENILGSLYPQLRTGTMLVFIGLTVLAFLAFIMLRRKGPVNFPKNILALFIIPFMIIPLDTLFFNGQLYDRGILYLVLIAPVVFVPLLLSGKRRFVRPVLAVIIAVIVVLCASTLFYQEALYINNDKGIAAADFLVDGAPPSYAVGGYYPYQVWSGHSEDYLRIKYSSVYNASASDVGVFYGSGTFMFDNTSELWYRQWGLQQVYDFYLDQGPGHYKVYDNGAYWVMFVRGS